MAENNDSTKTLRFVMRDDQVYRFSGLTQEDAEKWIRVFAAQKNDLILLESADSGPVCLNRANFIAVSIES